MQEATIHCDGQVFIFKVEHPDGRAIEYDKALTDNFDRVLGFASVNARECVGISVYLRSGCLDSVDTVVAYIKSEGYICREFKPPEKE